MRLVAVADTHTFERDLRPIPDGDVFVHAGDLCRGGVTVLDLVLPSREVTAVHVPPGQSRR